MSVQDEKSLARRRRISKAIAVLILFLVLDAVVALALWVASRWGVDLGDLFATLRENFKFIVVAVAIVLFVVFFIRDDEPSAPGEKPHE